MLIEDWFAWFAHIRCPPNASDNSRQCCAAGARQSCDRVSATWLQQHGDPCARSWPTHLCACAWLHISAQAHVHADGSALSALPSSSTAPGGGGSALLPLGVSSPAGVSVPSFSRPSVSPSSSSVPAGGGAAAPSAGTGSLAGVLLPSFSRPSSSPSSSTDPGGGGSAASPSVGTGVSAGVSVPSFSWPSSLPSSSTAPGGGGDAESPSCSSARRRRVAGRACACATSPS